MSTNTKGTVAVAVDFSEVAALVVEVEEETVEVVAAAVVEIVVETEAETVEVVAAAVVEIVVETEAVVATNQESFCTLTYPSFGENT
jgi:hypothetical protein